MGAIIAVIISIALWVGIYFGAKAIMQPSQPTQQQGYPPEHYQRLK